MAITKNKTQILDDQLSLRKSIDDYIDYYDYDYYDFYDNSCDVYCYCQYCWNGGDYEYLSKDLYFNKLVSRRGILRFQVSIPLDREIDMNSIYSKEIMRDLKIDDILGLSNKHKKTLGSVLNYEFDILLGRFK